MLHFLSSISSISSIAYTNMDNTIATSILTETVVSCHSLTRQVCKLTYVNRSTTYIGEASRRNLPMTSSMRSWCHLEQGWISECRCRWMSPLLSYSMCFFSPNFPGHKLHPYLLKARFVRIFALKLLNSVPRRQEFQLPVHENELFRKVQLLSSQCGPPLYLTPKNVCLLWQHFHNSIVRQSRLGHM